jgi:hypothetical protein
MEPTIPWDLASWLTLAARMAATAAFVVLASRVAERGGPLFGAMVATLPLSAAPAYLFVALDHDSTFIAASALASLAANPANVVFCLVHAMVAQSRGLAASLSAALGAWIVFALAVQSVAWTLASAIFLNVFVFAFCLPIADRFRGAAMPQTCRRWYDVPLRAGMVATLVAIVVGLSSRVGPTVTGILALFPIVLTCLVLIFQPRVGGPAVAALTANGIVGLAGYGAALVVLHIAAVRFGSPAALALALSVSIGWNLSILIIRRRTVTVRPPAIALSDPAPSELNSRERQSAT